MWLIGERRHAVPQFCLEVSALAAGRAALAGKLCPPAVNFLVSLTCVFMPQSSARVGYSTHLKSVKPLFREFSMKRNRVSPIFAMFLMLWLAVQPAWGVNKEMVQLQTQVEQLQQQMTAMQRSFDERMGVMKNLVEQDTDAINKAATALNALQATLQTNLQKQQGDSSAKLDQLSGQIQSLNDTMDELKVRLAKVSKQLEDMQATQQSAAATQAQQQALQQAQASAPPPDVLYNNAIRDYNGGKTDLAGNSYFYLAEIQYRQANYQQAVQSYDQVLQNFPSGNKAASAQLKKGFALIELGKQDEGVAELRHLLQRYPHSPEALRSEERLRKLGVAAKAGQGE